jgi:hypothetical protein
LTIDNRKGPPSASQPRPGKHAKDQFIVTRRTVSLRLPNLISSGFQASPAPEFYYPHTTSKKKSNYSRRAPAPPPPLSSPARQLAKAQANPIRTATRRGQRQLGGDRQAGEGKPTEAAATAIHRLRAARGIPVDSTTPSSPPRLADLLRRSALPPQVRWLAFLRIALALLPAAAGGSALLPRARNGQGASLSRRRCGVGAAGSGPRPRVRPP